MLDTLKGKNCFITGASSGIGLETAKRFAEAGVRSLVLGARRFDRIESLAKKIQPDVHVFPFALDVRDSKSCQMYIEDGVKKAGSIDVLINNAGLSLSLDDVAVFSEEEAVQMIDTNVLGLLRITKLALPHMFKQGCGHIINIGSIAGYMAYEGGSVYCATKYAVRAITQSLRLELLGKNIRVSNIAPGMTETEFSLVRYKGNNARAEEVYKGVEALKGKDIAEIIWFTASLPHHINIDELLVRPLQQAGLKVHRKT